jgi:hypothetical protein
MDYSTQPYQFTDNDGCRKQTKQTKNYYNFSTLNFFFSFLKKQACSHQGQGKRKDLQQKIVVYEWTIRQTFCFKLVIALWHFVRGTSENGDIKKQKHFTLSSFNHESESKCKFKTTSTYIFNDIQMINKVLQILQPGYVRPQIKTLNRRLHVVIKTES